VTDETDYLRLADNPGAISRGGSNRDAKGVTLADSASFVQSEARLALSGKMRTKVALV
jgi:hypothetical protein